MIGVRLEMAFRSYEYRPIHTLYLGTVLCKLKIFVNDFVNDFERFSFDA